MSLYANESSTRQIASSFVRPSSACVCVCVFVCAVLRCRELSQVHSNYRIGAIQSPRSAHDRPCEPALIRLSRCAVRPKETRPVRPRESFEKEKQKLVTSSLCYFTFHTHTHTHTHTQILSLWPYIRKRKRSIVDGLPLPSFFLSFKKSTCPNKERPCVSIYAYQP